MPTIKFLNAGLHCSFQDTGRLGYQHLGISPSGCIDNKIYNLVDTALDNAGCVLEFAEIGPSIQIISGTVVVCLIGDFNFNIIKQGKNYTGDIFKIYHLYPGDILEVGKTKDLVYGYIGFKNSPGHTPSFGSYSMNKYNKLGYNNGNNFSKDDILFLKPAKDFEILNHEQDISLSSTNIFVTPGPQFNKFTLTQIDKFFSSQYTVTNKRDRMGMWLDGPKLKYQITQDLMSEGIVRGAIQITPSGDCVTLLSHHGVTGGYPKIAIVSNISFRNLAQCKEGTDIKFVLIDEIESRRLYELTSR